MQNNTDSKEQFSEEQGQELIKLARQTIMARFNKKPEHEAQVKAYCFQRRRGVFVTLKKDGMLRGCIGCLTGTESIADGVKRHAINAAFDDMRFSPLTVDELDQIEISVSILTEPQPLEYENHDDLLAKLHVNVDGVILRQGFSSGTFLPQVWEQLPKKEDFLSHLCLKAGLRADAWQKSKLEVLTYQVRYFDEKDKIRS